MPAAFRIIGMMGTVAMLWVDDHQVIANVAEMFWHGPIDMLPAVTPVHPPDLSQYGPPTLRCRLHAASFLG